MMLVGVLALTAIAPAWTQIIPNPLVRPPRSSSASADQPAPGAQTRGATAAPSGRTARGADGEGLPAEAPSEKSPSERLANLYVSAVIGDRAVLRSLEVSTVPSLNSNVSSGGGSGGGATSGSPGGGGATGGNVAGLRSQSYVVRNGEVVPFLDKLRLLVRVRDTTVTLFDVTDIPAGNYDPLDLMDRGFPVAFRGSVDSVQSAPYVPPNLIAPGAGLDGTAFGKARDTSVRSGSSTSTSSGSNSSTGSSSNSGNDNNP